MWKCAPKADGGTYLNVTKNNKSGLLIFENSSYQAAFDIRSTHLCAFLRNSVKLGKNKKMKWLNKQGIFQAGFKEVLRKGR